MRELLDAITLTADVEGASGFDPSGSSGLSVPVDSDSTGREGSISGGSYATWESSTDETSASRKTSLLDFGRVNSSDSDLGSREGSRDRSYNTDLDGLNGEGKESFLIAMFPALRPFDVKLSLKKYKGDANRVIDDLTFQSFLEENGERQRGVDGFEHSELSAKTRKNGKKKLRGTKYGAPITPSAFRTTQWDLAKEDAQFKASRTGLPLEKVTSLYHKHGASLRGTILAILDKQAISQADEDPTIERNASLLAQEFPTLPTPQTLALVRLTYPSTANAHELAEVLRVRPKISGTISPIQIELRHTPIQLDIPSSATLKPSATPRPLDTASASAAAFAYTEARDTAFTQATAYYRKSKSDHLMGGAAAYYSQLGHDFNARAKDADNDAADSLVAAQSSKKQLDLHGVDVKNALRISREKVTGWWHDLGEGRLGNKGSAGFKIVTGVGNHSQGGRAKIGPAVAKMLIREGWKVEVGSGALVVTGVAKSR